MAGLTVNYFKGVSSGLTLRWLGEVWTQYHDSVFLSLEVAAATLLTGFGAAGLTGLFFVGPLFNALRAEAAGAAFARSGVDDFDFAAVFLDLATALAMTCKQSARGEGSVRLTPFWAAARKLRSCPQARYGTS